MNEKLVNKILELAFGGVNTKSIEDKVDVNNSILSSAIGKYVIVRSRNEGVNAGVLKCADNTGCVLSNARRIWYIKPSKNSSWYEGVANYGLSDESKVSCPVDSKFIMEDYSITLCTDVAMDSIIRIKSHEG